MSTQTTTVNTGSQYFVNSNTAKIFLGGDITRQEAYVNNSGYNPVLLPAGTVMGRIAASNAIVPCSSYATDGSQYPIGILIEDINLAAGASMTIGLAVGGRVAQELLVFFPTSSGQTLETVSSNRRMKDHIQANTFLVLVPSTEMSDYDNS